MTLYSRFRRHNLPSPLSSFIGREGEIAEVKKRLSVGRLLTLTGPGGCGKTRLAVRVASDLSAEFVDGVWLAELAALADDGLVLQAVASALGIHDQAGNPLIETLTDHLKHRHTLLVLDNCEHLVVACAWLAETLLQACPGLHILATSRENLSIQGEVVWSVPPLSLPDPQPRRDPSSKQSALLKYKKSEAVQLFVARAEAALPAFSLTEQNGEWVADICRRLDGIPLAIELAAAFVRALSVQQIAERLDDSFQLLMSGNRTAPPRHQTLKATLDWSYALLSEKEQRALQHLSIFAGGATLDAAEWVCSDGELDKGGRIKGETGLSTTIYPSEVPGTLLHLVEKSLVIAEKPEQGQARYHLLETVRQYAHEKLLESGELSRVCNLHLDYFLQLAQEAEPKLDGSEQITRLDLLEREHDNLRAALGWAFGGRVESSDSKRVESGVQLAGALIWFWFKRSHWSEGRYQLQQALSQNVAISSSALAKALFGAGLLASFQNDSKSALSLYERSLTLYKEMGDKRGVADNLIFLAQRLMDLGDYTPAVALSEEGLNLHKQIENKTGVASATFNLGELALFQCEYHQATIYLEEGLALYHELGDQWGIGLVLRYLSYVAFELDDLDRASAYASESLALFRELGDRRQIGSSLYALALANQASCEIAEPNKLLVEALPMLYEVKDKRLIADCLEAFAGLATIDGKYNRAARLFGMAEAILQAINAPVAEHNRYYESNVATLHTKLDRGTLEKLWADGQGLTLEQAIEYALSESGTTAVDSAILSKKEAKEKFGGLTAREREATALIAQGKSNREIAEAMIVDVKTVETYVTRILNKLGLDSRVQIAIWAIEKGLARSVQPSDS